MVLLDEAVEKKKFDTRMIERNVARNVVSSVEVEKMFSQLPDDEESAIWVSTESLEDESIAES